RQPQVTVVKERVGLKDQFVGRERRKRDADEAHLDDAEHRRKEHFAKVKAEAGGNVEIRINVMNVVESPQPRDLVVREMPVVKVQIEEQESGNQLRPRGERHEVDQTERLG